MGFGPSSGVSVAQCRLGADFQRCGMPALALNSVSRLYSVFRRVVWISCLVFTFVLSTVQNDANASGAVASFDPVEVAVGSRVNYVVKLSVRGEPSAVALPEVEGLSWLSDRPSVNQSIRVINGVQSVELSLSYWARALREGVIVVPAWSLPVGGGAIQVPPARLRVLSASERPSSPIFMRLECLEELYSGQVSDLEMTLFLRSDVVNRVRGVGEVEFEAEGLVIDNLSEEYRQGREQEGGAEYVTLTWTARVTAVKQGDFSLLGSVGVSVLSRDSGFGTFLQQSRTHVIETGLHPVRVRSVPVERQPDGYTGAIGVFTLSTKLSSDETTLGEPVSLLIELGGRGNFERIGAPVLNPAEGFRVFEPTDQFEATSSVGVEGRKVFEYVLIAERAGELATPEGTFSFFDPISKEYMSFPVRAQRLSVREPVRVPAALSNGLDGAGIAGAEVDFPPLDFAPGPVFASVEGVTKRWSFLGPQIVVGLVLLGFVILGIRAGRHLSAAQRESERLFVEVSRAVTDCRSIAASGDVEGFAMKADFVLRSCCRFSGETGVAALSSAEIRRLLKAEVEERKQTWPEGGDRLFGFLDSVRFAGSRVDAAELQDHAGCLAEIAGAISGELWKG